MWLLYVYSDKVMMCNWLAAALLLQLKENALAHKENSNNHKMDEVITEYEEHKEIWCNILLIASWMLWTCILYMVMYILCSRNCIFHITNIHIKVCTKLVTIHKCVAIIITCVINTNANPSKFNYVKMMQNVVF